jgi:uncharacterized protein (DUF885 family)
MNRVSRLLITLMGLGLAAGSQIAANGRTELDTSRRTMQRVIERYVVDRATLIRSWIGSSDAEPLSPAQFARLRQFYAESIQTVEQIAFDGLDQEGRIDYLLLSHRLHYEVARLDLRERELKELEPLVPFGPTILALDEARREMRPVKPEESARRLSQVLKDLAATRRTLESAASTAVDSGPDPRAAAPPPPASPALATQAAAHVGRLRDILKGWFAFYNGYDPAFSWWVGQTYKQTDQALGEYATFLESRLGRSQADGLHFAATRPLGRDALLLELQREMIPYTPEELIAIANNELAWCTREMLTASREMGFGEDWHAALEKVKTMHAEPGRQPEVVHAAVLEGIDFVEKHDLVTVPPLAKETWRMQMMSPEQQLVNPFFTGGEVLAVSFPTDAMTFEQKMMSMRGNNVPFSRATAFHEMIPGHALQQFMSERYHAYRAVFDTPFWWEGNAFWWEMLLYDQGFPRTPEERIGMLFWRMHRCARIIFSLSYHLGTMTPQQAVEFLVQRIGHEPDNAMGEVRRAFDGSYSPLYQCAYMLGALQFRALHDELVTTKKMTNRAFHDAILKENAIPVELIRADLVNERLTRDYKTSWKFYGPIPPSRSPGPAEASGGR